MEEDYSKVNEELLKWEEMLEKKQEGTEETVNRMGKVQIQKSKDTLMSLLSMVTENVMETCERMEREAVMAYQLTSVQTIMQINKNIQQSIRSVKQKIASKTLQSDYYRETVKKVEREMYTLDEVRRNATLSFHMSSSHDARDVAEQIARHIYLRSEGISPDFYEMELVFSDKKANGVKVSCVPSVGRGYFSDMALKMIKISFTLDSVVGKPKRRETLFDGSLESLLMGRRAQYLDKSQIVVYMPLYDTFAFTMTIRAKVFGSPVRKGVLIYEGRRQTDNGKKEEKEEVNTGVVLTEQKEAIINDHLDNSDYVSLDMTNRDEDKDSGSKSKSGNSENTIIVSQQPTFNNRHLKPSRPTNLSQLNEVTEEDVGDVTVFSPRSDRCTFSTMRPTLVEAELADALDQVQKEKAKEENKSNSELKDSHEKQNPGDISAILKPSSSADRLSVEEMQRSLSREGTPNTSEEMLLAPHLEPVQVSVSQEDAQLRPPPPSENNLDPLKNIHEVETNQLEPTVDVNENCVVPLAERSISFAGTTTIYQELSTPQVNTRQKNRRYAVLEGSTKTCDGSTALAAKLLAAQKAASADAEDKNHDAESDDHHGSLGSSNESPMEVSVCDYSVYDPHIDLNASKAPLPEEICFGEEASIWNRIPEKGEACLDDPQLTQNGCRDRFCIDMKFLENSWICDLKQLETQKKSKTKSRKSKHDFGSDMTKVDLDFEEDELEVSTAFTTDPSSSGCPDKWFRPAFLCWMSSHSFLLASDPLTNKVAVFDELGKFKGWYGSKSMFSYPRNILALRNGGIAVLNKSCINFFNSKHALENTVSGNFHGLAECEEGVVTLEQHELVTWFRYMRPDADGKYQLKERKELYIILDKKMPYCESKCRCLSSWKNNLYVSDLGLNKVYKVDNVEGTQMDFLIGGWAEEIPNSPVGLSVDDKGNLLIVDKDSARLLIYNYKSNYVRTIALPSDCKNPTDVIRVGETLLLAVQGDEHHHGRVLRLKKKETK